MGSPVAGLHPAPWTWISGGCHPNRDTEAEVIQAGFSIDSSQRVAKDTLRRFGALKGAPVSTATAEADVRTPPYSPPSMSGSAKALGSLAFAAAI